MAAGKILISVPLRRSEKYFLNSSLYDLIKAKYQVVLLLGFNGGSRFEEKYGGENVRIYNKSKARMDVEAGKLAKIFMKYMLFHSDFRLKNKNVGQHNLITKKKVNPARYMFLRTVCAVTGVLGGWPVISKASKQIFFNQEMDDLIQRESPGLVISTVPAKIYSEYCLHNSAKRRSIPLVFYPTSWDDFTRSGEYPFEPDKILSWGPEMSRHAKEFFGFGEDRVAETGLLRMEAPGDLTDTKEAICRHFNIPSDHKLILAATNKPHMGLSLPGILEELLQDMEAGKLGKATLIIRPANSREENQRAYIRRFQDHPLVRINLPEADGEEDWGKGSGLEWRQIIAGVDVVVTVCSMMILEALYLGTPVVNVGYNYNMLNEYGFDFMLHYNREVYQKIKELRGTTMAKSREELVEALNGYLADRELHRDRRQKVMEHWDVQPLAPETRSSLAMREIEQSMSS